MMVSIGFLACDPGHGGTASIDNQSSEPLILHYQTQYKDTTMVIPGETKKLVLTFGGIGEGKSYPGILIEFKALDLSPSDTTRQLTKKIEDSKNWEIYNSNEHRFGSRPIECLFIITDEDIK